MTCSSTIGITQAAWPNLIYKCGITLWVTEMSHRVRSSLKKNTVLFLENHGLYHSEASVNFIKTRTHLPISCQISFFPNFVLSCNLKERSYIGHLDSIYSKDKQTWLHVGSVSFSLSFVFYYFLSNRELKSGALWQPRGVGGMYKSKGTHIHTYTYIYGWVTLIFGRNWHKIVKQLSSNQKEKNVA